MKEQRALSCGARTLVFEALFYRNQYTGLNWCLQGPIIQDFELCQWVMMCVIMISSNRNQQGKLCPSSTIKMSCDMTEPTKWVWAQRRLRSDWASDQGLHCPHEESLDLYLSIERTAKALIRLCGCPGWSESLTLLVCHVMTQMSFWDSNWTIMPNYKCHSFFQTKLWHFRLQSF